MQRLTLAPSFVIRTSVMCALLVAAPALDAFAQTRQQRLESIPGVIDVVTFDDYADWKTVAKSNQRITDTNLDGAANQHPKKASGADTRWDGYSNKQDLASFSGWKGAIRDFGSYCAHGKCLSYSWNEVAKNAKMKEHKGPANLFYFFGDGDPKKYRDVHVFFRIYIPSNRFPTINPATGKADVDQQCIDEGYLDAQGNQRGKGPCPYARHVPGHDYCYHAGGKWMGILSSRINAKKFKHATTGKEYGDFITYRGTCPNSLRCVEDAKWYSLQVMSGNPRGMTVQHNVVGWLDVEGDWANGCPASGTQSCGSAPDYQIPNDERKGSVDMAKGFDTVAAVEIRYKVNTSKTSKDGSITWWWYDKEGNASVMHHAEGLTLIDRDNWQAGLNMLLLEGNCKVSGGCGAAIDNYYMCGQGMHCSYYMDDLVIGKERIGPTYFRMIEGGDTTPPEIKAASPSGTQACTP